MKKEQICRCLTALFMLLCIVTAVASANEPRHALVIGNAAYPDAPLRNAVNDAQLIADVLENCGFVVFLETDCTLEQMHDAVERFAYAIRAGGAAMFFYAGHGIQVRGANFLQPVNARFTSESQVQFQCLNVGMVLAVMEDAPTTFNFVVLDACRNNPLLRGFSRSATAPGLAVTTSVTGTLIAYATAPGKVAEDGKGDNSTFSATLARYLQEPSLDAVGVFRNTQRDVDRELRGDQQPWLSMSHMDDFYFMTGAAAPSPPPAAPAPPPPEEALAMRGHLQVAVNAPNAKVWVDGRERGQAFPESALSITDLPVGDISVKVEAEGYESTEKQVRISANKITDEKFHLAHLPESIRKKQITVRPENLVFNTGQREQFIELLLDGAPPAKTNVRSEIEGGHEGMFALQALESGRIGIRVLEEQAQAGAYTMRVYVDDLSHVVPIRVLSGDGDDKPFLQLPAGLFRLDSVYEEGSLFTYAVQPDRPEIMHVWYVNNELVLQGFGKNTLYHTLEPGNLTIRLAYEHNGHEYTSTESSSYVKEVTPLNYKIKAGLMAVFDNILPTGYLNYCWRVNDKEISTTRNMTYVFPKEGIYRLEGLARNPEAPAKTTSSYNRVAYDVLVD